MAEHYQRFDPDETYDAWKTPPSVWRPKAESLGGFDLDPCTGPNADEIATEGYTERGLERRWHGTVWLNPPFSDCGEWINKAITETQSDRVETVVALVPNRTDTDWFHTAIETATAVCFRDGRIQFYGEDGRPSNAPMGIVFFVFGECTERLASHLDSIGWLVKPEQQPANHELSMFCD